MERIEAERLRREHGMSVKAIAAAVGVSPGTASRWLRDIPLTSAQRAALEAANPVLNGQCLGARRLQQKARVQRQYAQAGGRGRAAAADPLHLMGCMLYWAEGSKRRNQLVFTNSDPDMMATFVRFLRECYGVPDDRLRLTVNVHLGNGLSIREVESWWLDRLGLPRSALCHPVVNRISSASLRKRRTLPYGTARLVLCSTEVVQSIYGAVQAYAGVDRPDWLD
ncbi:MAG: helix-turn-helix domain-containing protein [Solirubrobacteraceae bacterium]